MIARDDYVVCIVAPRLLAPSEHWLDRAGGDSAVSLIHDHGLDGHSTIQRQAGAIKSIRFAWGSELRVYDLGDASKIEKIRGVRAHLWIADEAQGQTHLPRALAEAIMPTLADWGGQIIATGTPGRETDSWFRRVVEGDEEGWSRLHLWTWSNPAFGADPEERWQRVIDRVIAPARRRYKLTAEDVSLLRGLGESSLMTIAMSGDVAPEIQDVLDRCDAALLREFFGRWVASSSDYVFDWHLLGQENHYWCRQDDMWGSDAPLITSISDRVAALPRLPTGAAMQWRASIGQDIGWHDASATVVWVWSPTCPHAYELWSEAHVERTDTQVFERLAEIVDEVCAAGVHVDRVYGDLSGDRVGTQKDWDRRLRARLRRTGAPLVVAPKKAGADEQRYALNLDLQAGLLRIVAGSPLDVEGRHLRYRPTDEEHAPSQIWKRREVVLPDGRHTRPGDHCLDAARYAMQGLGHLRGQTPTAEDLRPKSQVEMSPAERRARARQGRRRR
jgi:hypothetical protein